VKKNYDNMLSRLQLISERYGQTDGQTELLYQRNKTIKSIDFGLWGGSLAFFRWTRELPNIFGRKSTNRTTLVRVYSLLTAQAKNRLNPDFHPSRSQILYLVLCPSIRCRWEGTAAAYGWAGGQAGETVAMRG